MSTVSRNCREREQRLRGGRDDTTLPPGSRRQDPWTLRSKRGSPQYSHIMRQVLFRRASSPTELCRLQPGPGHKCCAVWRWRVPVLRAKIAAFPDVHSRRTGGRGIPALRRTPSFHSFANRRNAGRGTYPPHFSLCPMPP